MRLRVGLLLSAALVACGPGDEDIVVFAAASLGEAFVEVAEEFEAAHPGVEVALSFAGSPLLAAQIAEGAPADIFAAADRTQMEALVGKGRVRYQIVFATNRIVLVVPAGNPASVESPADLGRPGVRVVLGAPEVPVGAYARALVADLGLAQPVEDNVISNETDVKEVLGKVRLGEAEAGIVYRTDVTDEVAGDVEVMSLEAPPALYPAAVLRGAGRGARAFVDFLTSPEGRGILEEHGFGAP